MAQKIMHKRGKRLIHPAKETDPKHSHNAGQSRATKKGIVKSDLGDTVIRIGCPPTTDSGFQGVIFDVLRKDKNNKEEEEKNSSLM